MEWSKVKNIILFMLVLTNLFLLFFVATPQAQTEMNEDSGRISAISILEGRGISVDSQIVPEKIVHHVQTIIPDRSSEQSLATNLLGTVSMLDLGGDVYRYVGEAGSIRFHSGGELSAQFTSGAYSLTAQSAQSIGASLMKTLELDAQLISMTEGETSTSLTYRQLWDGIPLLDYEMTLVFEADYLSEMIDGKRLCGTPLQQEVTSGNVATALMQFAAGLQDLGDVCRSITAISSAYSASTDLSGTIQLTPLWCIETDTGAYQLDLITGTLSRA